MQGSKVGVSFPNHWGPVSCLLLCSILAARHDAGAGRRRWLQLLHAAQPRHLRCLLGVQRRLATPNRAVLQNRGGRCPLWGRRLVHAGQLY